MKASNVSFFVTLTYADENLVWQVDDCYVDNPCLYKRHLQLYFKKVRKCLEPKTLKYYAVGEYGVKSNPGRPHYHVLVFYSGKFDKFKFMNILKDCWPYGISQVLPVNGAQGYVTKYILKFDKRDHPVKPFSLVSQGLGLDYLTSAMVLYHRKNLISFAMKPGGYKVSLPRYYKDKIFTPYTRLLIKKRADMRRRELELVKVNRYDIMFDNGINPFKESIASYQNRLYQSMKIFKQKKKI